MTEKVSDTSETAKAAPKKAPAKKAPAKAAEKSHDIDVADLARRVTRLEHIFNVKE